MAHPGSISPHDRFEARFYMLSVLEDGRLTAFMDGYRPQFYFRTTDVTGSVRLPDAVSRVEPGASVSAQVELVATVALEVGTRFAIREGGQTVGFGVVTALPAFLWLEPSMGLVRLTPPREPA